MVCVYFLDMKVINNMWLKLNKGWLNIAIILIILISANNIFANDKKVVMTIDGNPIYMSEWNSVKRIFHDMPTDMFAYYFKGVNLIAYAAKKEGLDCGVNTSGWWAKKAWMICYIRNYTDKITVDDLKKEIESYAKVNWKKYLRDKDEYDLSDKDKIMIRKKILESRMKDIEKEILDKLEKKYEVKVCSEDGC